jgi:hypothetical protein
MVLNEIEKEQVIIMVVMKPKPKKRDSLRVIMN